MATKPPTSALPNSSSLVFQSISDLSQLLMIFCAKAPVVFFSNQLIGKTPPFSGHPKPSCWSDSHLVLRRGGLRQRTDGLEVVSWYVHVYHI